MTPPGHKAREQVKPPAGVEPGTAKPPATPCFSPSPKEQAVIDSGQSLDAAIKNHASFQRTKDISESGAAKKLDAAIGKIHEAQKLNADMQRQYAPGAAAWHQCESIDDKLHDALALLGD